MHSFLNAIVGFCTKRRHAVLGKVVIPKPVNLPSQRLENHRLDPNVEIVPKGTLSWGSRPSSIAILMSTVDMKHESKGRLIPKAKVLLGKTEKFDDLMVAVAAKGRQLETIKHDGKP